jgi:hypothetical protein
MSQQDVLDRAVSIRLTLQVFPTSEIGYQYQYQYQSLLSSENEKQQNGLLT